jgi:hypothetical protein
MSLILVKSSHPTPCYFDGMIKHSQPWSDRSATSKLAHVVERTGLALTGVSCGLFVAAHVARSNINLFGSTAVIFAIMIYGAAGFYLGIDLPKPSERLHPLPLRKIIPKPDAVELLSAIGTFLAAVAAVVSVFSIILDEIGHLGTAIVISGAWAVGASMQIAAGVLARLRAEAPA